MLPDLTTVRECRVHQINKQDKIVFVENTVSAIKSRAIFTDLSIDLQWALNVYHSSLRFGYVLYSLQIILIRLNWFLL